MSFNQRQDHHYRSPINNQWRNGDDLEAVVLEGIHRARHEILVAVQELSLPSIAIALVEKQRQGIPVKVVLENTYSQPWSQESLADLEPHQRRRHQQLEQLADHNHDGVLSQAEREQGDAVLILQRGGVPMLDDTADGSAGSGLMHHKFMVIDRREVITGSANFTSSCMHGDPDDPQTRGNVNHLLRMESPELAGLFAHEFATLWGDGPGGTNDSRFGLGKHNGGLQSVQIGTTRVSVLFAPQAEDDPANGLAVISEVLHGARRHIDLALFVLSAQSLGNALAERQRQGVNLRVLVDPGFANRSFSEVLDLLGVAMPDRHCRLEAGNRPLTQGLDSVGSPRLPAGDKLHHKIAVMDDHLVISGSFNWSPSAAHQNDETLLLIDSPSLAAHFRREINRLWQGAELGVSPRLARKLERQRARCGSGSQRASSQGVPAEHIQPPMRTTSAAKSSSPTTSFTTKSMQEGSPRDT
ncbi:MAG: phospholipase D-like domain-containing protein [Cyanobacteriota bacterium]